LAHIDTLRYAKALQARGFERERAEALAEEQEIISAPYVEKSEVEIAVERGVHTLTVRMITFGLALAGLTVALVGFTLAALLGVAK